MTALTVPTPRRDTSQFPDQHHEFLTIARLASVTAGLVLSPEKAPMVFSRVAKRVKALQLANASEYCSYLESGSHPEELSELISVLTTNVTSFFRENHHFVYLRDSVLPELARRARAGDRVRFWSAGCSSGEEAVSLAIALLEFDDAFSSGNVRILATDIDSHILRKAARGLFARAQVEDLAQGRGDRFFEASRDSSQMQTCARIKDMIRVRQLNLIQPWPFKGPFDAIFCRNVAIYFSENTQGTLWRRFSQVLSNEGHLFIGHSERIESPHELGLESVHTTTYRRRLSQKN